MVSRIEEERLWVELTLHVCVYAISINSGGMQVVVGRERDIPALVVVVGKRGFLVYGELCMSRDNQYPYLPYYSREVGMEDGTYDIARRSGTSSSHGEMMFVRQCREDGAED